MKSSWIFATCAASGSRSAGQMQTASTPTVIYEDLSLALRTLRDLVSPKIEKIRIDSRETFQKIVQFVEELMPEIADRLEHYPGERPIFDLYGVEDEVQKALERKVPLKFRWLPDCRSGRGHEHHRRQHRRVCRPSYS